MAGDTQANSVVHLVGMDKPFFTAIAVALSLLTLIIVIGGEWRRWIALDDSIAAVKTSQHDYYEEINVWETDTFNREKDVDAALKARFGWDTDRMFGKLKPPPVPKEK